ncbi:hypothetical protein ACFOZ5_17685 [Marinobacter lacisalsi]|uniref:Uncharacterized protein n=1 Tax=Marinobacter lacisalsi TaxID=475979 RepID=A0ABV8QM28_9GAMM
MSQLVITSLKTLAVLVALMTASQSSARPLDIPVNTVQMPEAPAEPAIRKTTTDVEGVTP